MFLQDVPFYRTRRKNLLFSCLPFFVAIYLSSCLVWSSNDERLLKPFPPPTMRNMFVNLTNAVFFAIYMYFCFQKISFWYNRKLWETWKGKKEELKEWRRFIIKTMRQLRWHNHQTLKYLMYFFCERNNPDNFILESNTRRCIWVPLELSVFYLVTRIRIVLYLSANKWR